MKIKNQITSTTTIFLLLLLLLLLLTVSNAVEETKTTTNPFTPRASLIRYWSKEIRNGIPKSPFLLSKASPLNAVESAAFSKLASSNSLGTHLPDFCSSAKLFCYPDPRPSLEKHDGNVNFAVYHDKKFTSYGTAGAGGFDTFKNYSDAEPGHVDNFRRYSRDASGRKDKFSSYVPFGDDPGDPDQRFNSYGAGATGGSGEFKEYHRGVNIPTLRFTSYSDDGNARAHTFSTYSTEANVGDENFTSYGKNGNGVPNVFSTYANNSNVIASGFANYGESGNSTNDKFVNYGASEKGVFIANIPTNDFRNYGNGGNAGVDSFTTYRELSNLGEDSFQSYAKNSNAAKVNFRNYGKSYNGGTDNFTGYGQGAENAKVGFQEYVQGVGRDSTFKEYADKKAVSFSQYSTDSVTATLDEVKEAAKKSGISVNKWVVEPGKFFREKMLKKGTVMPMPDIRDKMPKRSFLPRTITSKIPFSSSKIEDIKGIFHAADDSAMEKITKDALAECERAPSAGESKRCVGSAEDMIDFATSVLGRDIAVRNTENVKGSKGDIVIGEVKGINGGMVTKSVSCHQTLYPYLVYYCHSVPKVRVYEAALLDPISKAKINHGVAICHLDTSSWSATHGAFLSLGSEPGKIEVCHWIFENDMTWTVAD